MKKIIFSKNSKIPKVPTSVFFYAQVGPEHFQKQRRAGVCAARLLLHKGDERIGGGGGGRRRGAAAAEGGGGGGGRRRRRPRGDQDPSLRPPADRSARHRGRLGLQLPAGQLRQQQLQPQQLRQQQLLQPQQLAGGGGGSFFKSRDRLRGWLASLLRGEAKKSAKWAKINIVAILTEMSRTSKL